MISIHKSISCHKKLEFDAEEHTVEGSAYWSKSFAKIGGKTCSVRQTDAYLLNQSQLSNGAGVYRFEEKLAKTRMGYLTFTQSKMLHLSLSLSQT